MKQFSIFFFALLICVISSFAQKEKKEPPKITVTKYGPLQNLNNKGFELKLEPIENDTLVVVRNMERTKFFSLKDWKNQPEIFEKKYGKLPIEKQKSEVE